MLAGTFPAIACANRPCPWIGVFFSCAACLSLFVCLFSSSLSVGLSLRPFPPPQTPTLPPPTLHCALRPSPPPLRSVYHRAVSLHNILRYAVALQSRSGCQDTRLPEAWRCRASSLLSFLFFLPFSILSLVLFLLFFCLVLFLFCFLLFFFLPLLFSLCSLPLPFILLLCSFSLLSPFLSFLFDSSLFCFYSHFTAVCFIS